MRLAPEWMSAERWMERPARRSPDSEARTPALHAHGDWMFCADGRLTERGPDCVEGGSLPEDAVTLLDEIWRSDVLSDPSTLSRVASLSKVVSRDVIGVRVPR